MQRIEKYIGPKKGVYLKKFDKIEQGRISWNWCGFLVSGLWLLYRKMYAYFFAIFGIVFAIELILNFAVPDKTAQTISCIISLAFNVAIGLWGDNLYYRKLKKLAAFEESANIAVDDMQYVKKNGGTSAAAVVIYIIVWIVAVVGMFSTLLI